MTTKPTEKSFLRKYIFYVPSWKRLLCTTALTTVATLGALEFLPQTLPARGLTFGEEKMLREHFKDSIDYKKFRLHSSPFMDVRQNFFGMEAETLGSTIVYRSGAYQADFSKASDIDRNVFIHEATHVWQNQNCRLTVFKDAAYHLYTRVAGTKTPDEIYDYDLSKGKDLRDFNIEQQGMIVADYAVHISQGKPALLAESASKENTPARYEKVLEKFKKDPGYTKPLCKF